MTLDDLYQRKAPFLHRSWIKGLKSWQNPAETMGNIVSGQLAGDASPQRKRRRVSTPESLDVDHLIASPKTSDTRSALRVEVLKVCHKDSKKVRTSLGGNAPRSVVTTKANCRITVNDLTDGQQRVLHCQNQVCDLTTFKNPVGPHRIARVNLPRPFFVPLEAIFINRDDDGAFDFSDAYELVIEFESASASPWPPLDAGDFGSSAFPDTSSGAMRRVVLMSRFQDIFGKRREPVILSTRHKASKPYGTTDYVMDVDLRWSSGFRAWKRLARDSMPSITAIDPDTDMGDDHFPPMDDEDSVAISDINGMNEPNGHLRSDDDQTEGEQTPSRSLRTRDRTKTYNLKLLSDQARGKDRKKRSDAGGASEGRVTYLLPLDQPVQLDYHRCVTCGSCHETLLQLQMHLQTYHPDYDYLCENTNQGPQFRVRHRRYDPNQSPSKTFQLKPTSEPFNLQTFLRGDSSWVTSRVVGSAHEDFLATPSGRSTVDRMMSQSPTPRQPVFSSKTTLPRRSGRAKEPSLVPRISQPLFHPISKARLRPGDPVPSPQQDSTWLIQKHRESIADFSDVTPAEKDFIWEWDGYILKQKITSSVYLPRAWLGFVQQKAPWLVAKSERMREFGKHASVLLAREVLTDEVIKAAMEHINRARSLRTMDVANAILPSDTEAASSPPKLTEAKKTSNGCAVCRLPVRGPRLLICSNKVRINNDGYTLYNANHFVIDVSQEAISYRLHRRRGCNRYKGTKMGLQHLRIMRHIIYPSHH